MKKEIKPIKNCYDIFGPTHPMHDSYAFIDREGNKITRKDYMAQMAKKEGYKTSQKAKEEKAKKVGKAYGFFDCNAPREEIEAELPTIRDIVKTPSKLELLLNDIKNLRGEAGLMAISKEAQESRIRYVLEATYPDASNRETADEVAAILNQAYQSPLYTDGEQFSGEVVFKEKGKYVFL